MKANVSDDGFWVARYLTARHKIRRLEGMNLAYRHSRADLIIRVRVPGYAEHEGEVLDVSATHRSFPTS